MRVHMWLMAVIFLLVFVPARAASGEIPLLVGVEAYYPPFAFLDSKGELTGFDVDLSRALCEQMKRPCEVRAFPFQELPGLVQSGGILMAVAGMGATPERMDVMDFSDRYYRSRSIYIGRPQSVTISPEGLRGKKIGAQSGTMQGAYVLEHWKGTAEISLGNYDELLGWLKQGRIDVALIDGLPGYEFLKSAEGAAFEVIGEALSADTGLSVARIAVRKGNRELLDALNAAIGAVRRNGIYDTINRKYFDYSIY